MVDPSPTPDWNRLQRALAIEAEHGFNDMEGKQQRFSAFLEESLGQIEGDPAAPWQDLTLQYREYANLSFAQRQHLVAQTRRQLYHARKDQQLDQQQTLDLSSAPAAPAAAPNAKPGKAPKTAELNLSTAASPPAASPYAPKAPARPVTLDQAITYLPGIGPKLAERLAKLGLYIVRDLLYYYPRDHIDYARQVTIRDLTEGETVTLVATVQRCTAFTSPKNPKLTILELVVRDPSGQLRLSRFYAGSRYSSKGWQEQQKRLYPKGAAIAASGLVKKSKYGMTLDNPELEVLEQVSDAIESLKIGRLLPVYPLTEGVQADLVRRAVVAALPAAKSLREALPDGLLSKYEMPGIQTAVTQIHFPDDRPQLDQARRRLIFDEFFYLQLGLLTRRQSQRQEQVSAALVPTGELIDNFYQVLPFELTQAQKRVVNDILQDLQRTVPMNRLVQGDVGSGKTVVAVIALLAAVQSGFQAALMAPTEVLAEQHYRKLVSWLNLLHIPVELLTGSTKAAKRRQIHAQLQTGELPILVGTHALIQDSVQFNRLGLAVIDEQHRFGVAQRAKLQQKGEHPHVLTMTATPIPRTLALTLHGDLDVSQIDELPPGRKPIQTTALGGGDRLQAYDLIRRQIAQGHQCYVVLPLVEESEKLDLKSAIDEYQELKDNVFTEFSLGLLHGRMTSAEKDDAISRFRDHHTQILVSTTVVEVGVDVPNASVMLIEHAERFGLSQLHQLRGRVGRGAAQSFCLLMSSSKSENSRQRLKVMEQSQDGFFIAEMDLRFRGPGEVLGSRQSGLPDFALASLVEDQAVLEMARLAAERALEKDPTLENWPQMRQELNYRYQRLLGGMIFT